MTLTDQFERADQEAVDLALDNGIEELMAGACDAEIGPDVLADLLAHELTAMHRLMMRLAGAAHSMLDWGVYEAPAVDKAGRPASDTGSADLAVARLAGIASRLTESMRQGLVALARCRPLAEGEGVWLALHTLDGRCSDEEVRCRIAAAKAARAANASEPRRATVSQRAKDLRALVDEMALLLANEAKVKTMAALAADERQGVRFLARLFAHELGAEHGLMMRLAGRADAAFDRAAGAAEEPVVAQTLAGVVARLGDRFRRGMLTLQRLSAGPGGPHKVAGLVWGGPSPAPGGDQPATTTPANDAPDPAAAPAASAGHGVDRSESRGQTTDDRILAAAAGSPRRRAAGEGWGGGVAVDSLAAAGHGVDRQRIRRAA